MRNMNRRDGVNRKDRRVGEPNAYSLFIFIFVSFAIGKTHIWTVILFIERYLQSLFEWCFVSGFSVILEIFIV